MADKILKTVSVTYKDVETGKEHTQRDHYDMGNEDEKIKFLKSIVGFENPKVKKGVILKRVRFHKFFATKVEESFGRGDFHLISGYSDMLHVMKKAWKREEDISKILD